MIKLAVLVFSMAIVGCAHPRVVGFNNEAHTVDVQTSTHGTAADAQGKADDQCGGKAQLVSKSMKNSGAMAYKSFGGSTGILNTEEPVWTFRCPSSVQ
jgi:hypothetical protein